MHGVWREWHEQQHLVACNGEQQLVACHGAVKHFVASCHLDGCMLKPCLSSAHTRCIVKSCTHVLTAQVVQAKKSEPLSQRRLERCIQWVLANPVVPGYGGAAFSLLSALASEPALSEMAQKSAKCRVPAGLDALDPKVLEARYALPDTATAAQGPDSGGAAAAHVRSLMEGHDQISDLLGKLALQVDQAAARHKEPAEEVRPLWGPDALSPT